MRLRHNEGYGCFPSSSNIAFVRLVYRALGDTPAEQSVQSSFTSDAAVVTPVFFGYMPTTEADVDAARAKVGK